jgi:AcrR family transcriptional regulator
MYTNGYRGHRLRQWAPKRGSRGGRPVAMSRASATRERLIAAAIELVAARGVAQLSAEAAAEAAGVARSTFYEHFRDREECFLAALEAIVDRVETAVSSAQGRSDRPRGPMAVIGPLIDFVRSEEAASRCLFMESLSAGSNALDRRDGLCLRLAIPLAREWADSDESSSDARRITLLVLGGVFRLLAMRLRHGPAALGEELTEAMEVWVGSYGKGDEVVWPRFAPIGPYVAPEGSVPAMPRPPALRRGRHRLSREEVRRNQRERILAATAELSYRQGFRNITVTDITAAARVARNVFYAEFRDREHAATEAHELFFQQSMTAAAAAFFCKQEWPDRVWGGGRALFKYWSEHPANLHLSIIESHAIGPAAAQRTYDQLSAFTLFLEEGYLEHPGNRELPRVISEALAGVMFEATYADLRLKGALTNPGSKLPALVYVILSPFLGVEAAEAFVEAKTSSADAT